MLVLPLASLVQFWQWFSETSLSAAFLRAVGACGSRPSGLRYLPVFGSGSDSVLALVAAALHSFSSFPSSAHVCAASEQPPFSEIPEDKRNRPQWPLKLPCQIYIIPFKETNMYSTLYTKDRHSQSTCSSCRRSPHSADSKSSFPFW